MDVAAGSPLDGAHTQALRSDGRSLRIERVHAQAKRRRRLIGTVWRTRKDHRSDDGFGGDWMGGLPFAHGWSVDQMTPSY